MDNNRLIIVVVFTIILVILLIKLVSIFRGIFSQPSTSTQEEPKLDPFQAIIREEVNSKVKPHLHSLDAMHQKSEDNEKKLSEFVFSLFQSKFSNHIEHNKSMVEEEICKCCSDYEGAECKEEFCLEGAGISCSKD